MKKVCIIGSGYVGLVSGVCFAELGNKVILVDNDKKKIDMLLKGDIPIYEPGLDKLLKKNKSRIHFTTEIKRGVQESEIIFICVGTPPHDDGSADLSAIEHVATEISRSMTSYRLIVEKSTVPVETGEWIKNTIERNLGKKKIPFDVASNPEFLREGTAIKDLLYPDRVVIGVESARAEKLLTELYKPLKSQIVVTDIKSAELIKHASNSFLAMKISFINSVANVCERVGADVTKVSVGMGMDKRIGKSFLSAGIGFGGFCFPKDLDAFYWISKKVGFDFKLLSATREVNKHQKEMLVKKIEDTLWILKDKTITFLGMAFKPNTDDMRMAPSIDLAEMLIKKHAKIKVYDPVAMDKAKEVLTGVQYCDSAYDALKSSDCAVLITEWDEFGKLDFNKVKRIMNQPVLIDGRNYYNPDKIRKLGFIYKGVGR